MNIKFLNKISKLTSIPGKRKKSATVLVFLTAIIAFPAHALLKVDGGIYVDKPSYQPGDVVTVHGAAVDGKRGSLHLYRLGIGVPEIAHTEVLNIPTMNLPFGSFVDFPDLSLDGRSTFTLEGWYFPTMVGGDAVVVAGQANSLLSAALLIDAEAKWNAGVHLNNGDYAVAQGPQIMELDRWYHLAMVFDGTDSKTLSLFIDGTLAASVPATGSVFASGLNFRLGARTDAPGDLKGIIDGRMDGWALWPRALSALEIADRKSAGETETDPVPPPEAVDLYVGFEDPYGDKVYDRSLNHHDGVIVNLGEQRLTGVSGLGAALGLYHDQLIDAQMPKLAQFQLPRDLESGFYFIAFFDEATGEVVANPYFFPSVLVRPNQPDPQTKLAVIVPTFTWQAYNTWPGDMNNKPITAITSRTRHPLLTTIIGGGNNSVYKRRGDGTTGSKFSGWKRPNRIASIINIDKNGFQRRAAMSYHLIKWLELQGWDYDIYTDHDFANGVSPLAQGNYKVVMFHSHHEYASRDLIEATYAFQDAGGSVISLSGNSMYTRAAFSGDVIEVRKVPNQYIWYRPGLDANSAIDGEPMGSCGLISYCEKSDDFALLGATLKSNFQPTQDPNLYLPDYFAKWVSESPDHWLWQGGNVADGTVFGSAPGGFGTVGHEADAWQPGIVPRGIVGEVQILASATEIPLIETNIVHHYDRIPPPPDLESFCEKIFNDKEYFRQRAQEIEQANVTAPAEEGDNAGHILYWRHKGGGYVLNIASAITAWGLGNDTVLTGLVSRALNCFANGVGCESTTTAGNP